MAQNGQISAAAKNEAFNSRKLLADIFAGISPPEDVVEGRA
jgi:hypothetical protein